METYDVEKLDNSITKGQEYASYGLNQTYSYADNSLFYALVNRAYYDYYYRVLRINLQWYDGFVMGWHNVQNGIFSTRIASALCDGVANQVLGKTIMFKKAQNSLTNTSLDFISNDWAKKVDFIDNIFTAAHYAYAAGTSLLKLNQSIKDVWLEAVRQDYFYYSTDFRNNVIDCTCFIKGYDNTNNSNSKEDNVNYFVVEHRCYKDMPKDSLIEYVDPKTGDKQLKKFSCIQHHVPTVEYRVHRFVGQVMQNLNATAMNEAAKGLEWNDIPKGVREMIKRDYNAVVFNKPMRLPFRDLGCQLILRGRDTTIPNIKVGQSILTNIRSYLEEYELAQAFSVRDMWNGQGQVGVPKALSIGDINNQAVLSGNKMNYQIYAGDPDKQKPIITQFEIRQADWANKINDILKKIATTIGMSPKIIASYLADATIQKTATQIDSDDDSVIAFVERERGYFERPINKILKSVCEYYSYSDYVEIKFGTPSLVSQDTIIKNTDFLYQNGYIDLKEALRRLNPDANESQLDGLLVKAQARQDEIKMQTPSQVDDFGNFTNV